MKTTSDLTRQRAAFFHLPTVCLFVIVLLFGALTTTSQAAPNYKLQVASAGPLKVGEALEPLSP